MHTSATGAATRKPGRGRAILLRLLVYGALLALAVATFQYAAYVQRPRRQYMVWRPPPFSCWRNPDPRTVLQQTCRDAWDVVRGRYYGTVPIKWDYYPREQDLPVAEYIPAWKEDFGHITMLHVYCNGQVAVSGMELSLEFLRAVLLYDIANLYGGHPDAVPLFLRIDSQTFYPRVERVLQTLHEVGIRRVRFAATDEDGHCGDTAGLDALVSDTTETNAVGLAVERNAKLCMPVHLAGDKVMIRGKVYDRVEADGTMAKYRDVGVRYMVTCSRSNTVQDLVWLLSMCAKHGSYDTTLLVPPASTNAPPRNDAK